MFGAHKKQTTTVRKRVMDFQKQVDIHSLFHWMLDASATLKYIS